MSLQENLQELIAETDRIIARVEPKDFPNDAVNWAALECYEAEKFEDSAGGIGVRVLVAMLAQLIADPPLKETLGEFLEELKRISVDK